MAEGSASALIVKRSGCPNALVIAPAMRNAFEHRAHARLYVYPDESGNTTHTLIRENVLSTSTGLIRASAIDED
jgi:hypothetical protein